MRGRPLLAGAAVAVAVLLSPLAGILAAVSAVPRDGADSRPVLEELRRAELDSPGSPRASFLRGLCRQAAAEENSGVAPAECEFDPSFPPS
jgi:hypothetical protein